MRFRVCSAVILLSSLGLAVHPASSSEAIAGPGLCYTAWQGGAVFTLSSSNPLGLDAPMILSSGGDQDYSESLPIRLASLVDCNRVAAVGPRNSLLVGLGQRFNPGDHPSLLGYPEVAILRAVANARHDTAQVDTRDSDIGEVMKDLKQYRAASAVGEISSRMLMMQIPIVLMSAPCLFRTGLIVTGVFNGLLGLAVLMDRGYTLDGILGFLGFSALAAYDFRMYGQDPPRYRAFAHNLIGQEVVTLGILIAYWH